MTTTIKKRPTRSLTTDRRGLVACRICGCTQDRACSSGCSWAEPDLCSTCYDFRNELQQFMEDGYRVTKQSLARLYDEVNNKLPIPYRIAGGRSKATS